MGTRTSPQHGQALSASVRSSTSRSRGKSARRGRRRRRAMHGCCPICSAVHSARTTCARGLLLNLHDLLPVDRLRPGRTNALPAAAAPARDRPQPASPIRRRCPSCAHLVSSFNASRASPTHRASAFVGQSPRPQFRHGFGEARQVLGKEGQSPLARVNRIRSNVSAARLFRG